MNTGATFKNTAFIYFDYNAPVTTNTTVNFIDFLNVPNVSLPSSFRVYPNPTNGSIIVELNELINDGQIIITDLTSRTLSSIHTSAIKQEVSLSAFSAGIYVVSVFSDGQITGRKKIVLR